MLRFDCGRRFAEIVCSMPFFKASPRDRRWGIGLGINNPKGMDRTKWRGKNQLGDVLNRLRDELLEEKKALTT